MYPSSLIKFAIYVAFQTAVESHASGYVISSTFSSAYLGDAQYCNGSVVSIANLVGNCVVAECSGANKNTTTKIDSCVAYVSYVDPKDISTDGFFLSYAEYSSKSCQADTILSVPDYLARRFFPAGCKYGVTLEYVVSGDFSIASFPLQGAGGIVQRKYSDATCGSVPGTITYSSSESCLGPFNFGSTPYTYVTAPSCNTGENFTFNEYVSNTGCDGDSTNQVQFPTDTCIPMLYAQDRTKSYHVITSCVDA